MASRHDNLPTPRKKNTITAPAPPTLQLKHLKISTRTCALRRTWAKREAASGVGLAEGVDKAEHDWQRMHHISEDLHTQKKERIKTTKATAAECDEQAGGGEFLYMARMEALCGGDRGKRPKYGHFQGRDTMCLVCEAHMVTHTDTFLRLFISDSLPLHIMNSVSPPLPSA